MWNIRVYYSLLLLVEKKSPICRCRCRCSVVVLPIFHTCNPRREGDCVCVCVCVWVCVWERERKSEYESVYEIAEQLTYSLYSWLSPSLSLSPKDTLAFSPKHIRLSRFFNVVWFETVLWARAWFWTKFYCVVVQKLQLMCCSDFRTNQWTLPA